METSEVFDTVLKKCTEIEQQVIDSVLEQAYKRKPTIEDYKNLELRFTDGIQHKYALAISGIEVGTIHRHYLNPANIYNKDYSKFENSFRVEFIPHKDFIF